MRLSYPQQPRFQGTTKRQVAAGCEFYDRLTADLSVVETWGEPKHGSLPIHTPWLDEPRDRGTVARSVRSTGRFIVSDFQVGIKGCYSFVARPHVSPKVAATAGR